MDAPCRGCNIQGGTKGTRGPSSYLQWIFYFFNGTHRALGLDSFQKESPDKKNLSETWFSNKKQKKDVNIDEDTMKKMAKITGGRYFRAADTQGLSEIYDEIDKLEKTKFSDSDLAKINDNPIFGPYNYFITDKVTISMAYPNNVSRRFLSLRPTRP